MSVRSSAGGASTSTGSDRAARYSPSESKGCPLASITRPSNSEPTRRDGLAPHVITRSPKRIPCGFSRHIDNTLAPRKATISPANVSPVEFTISQESPTELKGPEDSTRLPTTSVTLPLHRTVELEESQFPQESSALVVIGCPVFGRVGRKSRSRLPSVEHPNPSPPHPARFQCGKHSAQAPDPRQFLNPDWY